MTSVFRVMRFDAVLETYVIGISQQFLGTQHYAETTVPNVGEQIDMLRAAWTALAPDFATWQSSLEQTTVNEARRQFHVDDSGDTYIVGVNDQFRGQAKFVQCILPKPIASYIDMLEQAWDLLGPQLEAWRQDIIDKKIVSGTYFHLGNDQPVLD